MTNARRYGHILIVGDHEIEMPEDRVEFRMGGQKVRTDDPNYKLKKNVKLEMLGYRRK